MHRLHAKVGRAHPLKAEARAFFLERRTSGDVLVTSAEVLQELLYAYLPVNRAQTLEAALTLARTQLVPSGPSRSTTSSWLSRSRRSTPG